MKIQIGADVKRILSATCFAMLATGAHAQTKSDTLVVTIVYDGRKTKYEDYVTAFRKIGYDIRKTAK